MIKVCPLYNVYSKPHSLNFVTKIVFQNVRIPKSIQACLWKQQYSLNGFTFVMDVMLHLRQKFTNYSNERYVSSDTVLIEKVIFFLQI